MDRKNVIKGLENLRETIRNATQYTFTSGGICAMNMKRIDNAIALLKEQEAVEPTWNRGKPFCGACGLLIHGGKFCSECGKPILWKDR